jgi:hypothetical protein
MSNLKRKVMDDKLLIRPSNTSKTFKTGCNHFKRFCAFTNRTEENLLVTVDLILEFINYLKLQRKKDGQLYLASSISSYVHGAIDMNKQQSIDHLEIALSKDDTKVIKTALDLLYLDKELYLDKDRQPSKYLYVIRLIIGICMIDKQEQFLRFIQYWNIKRCARKHL